MAKYGIDTETTVHVKGMSVGSSSDMGGGNLAEDVIEKMKMAVRERPYYETSATTFRAWDKSDVNPFGWSEYRHLLVNPDSEGDSFVVTTADVSGGQVSPALPIVIPEQYRDDVKYVIIEGIDNWGSQGNAPIMKSNSLAEITGYADNGRPSVRFLNGRKASPDDPVSISANIPSGSRVFLLTGKPSMYDDELSKQAGSYDCVVLDSDCPALSPDAKKGDVYRRALDVMPFLNYNSFMKLGMAVKVYSFEERIRYFVEYPNVRIPALDDSGDELGVFCVDSFDFENNAIDKGFFLMLEDYTQNGSMGTNTYRKGDFLYVDFTDNAKTVKVPFNLFVAYAEKTE